MAVNLGPAPTNVPITQGNAGVLTQQWFDYLNRLNAALLSVQQTANNAFGTNYLPLASQPSLGSADRGYVLFVTDYAHFVYWDGSAWQWLDGDRPLKLTGFAADPGVGWARCDGSATTYLVVGGASLTTASFTTPDLKTNAAYLKSASSYTGTVNAASGSSATGTSGATAPGVSGNTDDESAHTHDVGSITATVHDEILATPEYVSSGGTRFNVLLSGTSGPGSAHHHGTSGITVNSHTHTVPALGVGTIDMANVGALMYVRR